MKKVPIWCAIIVGGVWLGWAMLGDAPGELKPTATAELLQRTQNITPTPTKAAPTPTRAPISTSTPIPPPLPTATRTPLNMALCQDALERRQAFLAETFDAQRAALWGSKTTEELTAEIDSMLHLDDKRMPDKELRKELVLFALTELSNLRSATAAVERYCGQ